MTVDPPKAEFQSPSRFAADVAESDIYAHRHWQFILGTAPVSSPPPDDHSTWVGADSASPPELLALLKAYPPDAMRAYPVGTVVNSPKNDKPECIEPVE